jgi:hypothetical protein
MTPLMDRAKQAPQEMPDEPDDDAEGDEGSSGSFQRPDISKFVPPDAKDAVDRVVAAGLRIMTSPEMRAEVQAAIDSPDPMPKKLSENVTGLLLTLDQQAQGGIPVVAIFPAAMELLGEASEVMSAAGQDVTQEDYNDAALMMYAQIGQKLGGQPQDLLGAAAESMKGQNPDPGASAPTGEPPPAGMPPAAA